MSGIAENSSLEDIAGMVSSALREAGISVVLTGGAVVSIYSQNEYLSYDLDFIVEGIGKKVDRVMESLGFAKQKGRHFRHPRSKFFVEFPKGPLQIGDSPGAHVVERKTSAGVLRLLSPTDCVKDRLAAFYHWNDRQCLDQALAVAASQPVNFAQIKRWSKAEGQSDKLQEFLSAFAQQKPRGK